MNIVSLDTRKENGKVVIEDSHGEREVTNDPVELLYFMLEPYERSVKVVWDVLDFIKPVFALLPKDVTQKLMAGERAEFQGFRLWLGELRHGYMFGVSYKQHERIQGNIYRRKVYDEDIFELKQYYPDNDKPADIYGIADKGDNLVSVLERMGLNPRRLTSAAAIYKECVLDKMPIPTIWNMPEECYPMMEMAANYVREWHGDYESGNWDGKQLFKYDLTSAYPAALAGLPNLAYARFIPHGEQKETPYWGILKGKLSVNSVISPMVDEQGKNMVGEFEDAVITTDDWRCLKTWKLGKFVPASGWYLMVDKDYKIFEYIMRRLFDYRGGNPLRDFLAKAMSVSVWGKFLEMHGDKFGDCFNGIYACMVTSRVRARVCDFIYERGLQDDVVEVTVDGIRAKKGINIGRQRRFGEWRVSD